MTPRARWAAARADRSHEDGYVAVMTGLLLFVFMGLAAFAVDVGNWYVVGQQEQRAADAAALAGVPSLPGSPASAFAAAQDFSTINGFENNANLTTVTPALDGGRPTRLRVTVSRTVSNIFGPLLGVPTTKISRTAVADFAGPVPMGSPCNGFANDPDPGVSTVFRSANCLSSTQMWANIGSHGEKKQSGDAFHDGNCSTTPIDDCTGPPSEPNSNYDPNGYVYTVTVTKPVNDLRIQVFDPSQVVVGDHCDSDNLDGAAGLAYPTKVSVSNPAARYVKGDDTAAKSAWCTGDRTGGPGGGLLKTQFTVHAPGVNAWDPVSWPIQQNCGPKGNPRDFNGFNERLDRALNKTNATYFEPEVAETFRNWVDLCAIAGPVPAGTYAIQVRTNGPGADPTAGGHNRFGLRAFGSGSADKDFISVAGFNKMAIFANFAGTTQFYLARVPSGAAGQILNVRLFDVGDGSSSGTITILKPTESSVALTNCKATGTQPVLTRLLPACQLTSVSSATHQGRWQNIAVPIPSTYTCTDSASTGCWVKLEYDYGSGNPADATSWTASIEGDPVRLVE